MRVRPIHHVACAMALVALVASAARAAEPNEGGTAAAESLFQEARKLTEAKKYAEACPKFLASHKLAPAVGTLLNLADCYEKNNQLASAWARFHEAVALAQRLNRPEREKIARERAEKLDARLIRLTIHARDKNVEVKLDGNALDSAVLGTPVPVDPGMHTIDATAKGKKSFSTTIDVSDKNRSPNVEVPALEDEVGPPTTKVKAVKPIETPSNGDADAGGSGQRTVGIAVGAIGLAGVGIGTFFGLRTSEKWDEAKARCSASFECDAAGVDLADQARTSGNVSTISFIVGGALLAAGAILFFTAPKKTDGMRLGVGTGRTLGSVVVGGSF